MLAEEMVSSFKTNICYQNIRLYNRILNSYRAIYYLNVTLAIYNGYSSYASFATNNTYSVITACFFGSLLINIIWIGGFINVLKKDLKSEKETLSLIF